MSKTHLERAIAHASKDDILAGIAELCPKPWDMDAKLAVEVMRVTWKRLNDEARKAELASQAGGYTAELRHAASRAWKAEQKAWDRLDALHVRVAK